MATPNDPCEPNPCGPHGTCRNGLCTYPECIINDDCPGYRACINRKCADPCVNACGLNAVCSAVRHNAVCSCPDGYTGSPFVRCERVIIATPALPVPECVNDEQCADDSACIDNRCASVCGPTNCGSNARCIPRLHRARCTCLPGYEGDAYTGCYSGYCPLLVLNIIKKFKIYIYIKEQFKCVAFSLQYNVTAIMTVLTMRVVKVALA